MRTPQRGSGKFLQLSIEDVRAVHRCLVNVHIVCGMLIRGVLIVGHSVAATQGLS